MKKIILTSTLLLTIMIAPIKRSEAVVGLVTGNPNVALTGLGLLGVSALCMSSDDCDDGYLGSFYFGFVPAILGILALDKQSNEFSFQKITNQKLIDSAGLNQFEVESYKENIDQLSIVFNEVNSKLDKNSTVKESKELWNSYSDCVDQKALSAAKKLLKSK